LNVLFVHEVDWLKKVVFDIHTLAESLSLKGHRVYAIDYENNWQPDGFLGLGKLKTTEIPGVSRAFPSSSVTLRRPGFIRLPVLSRLSAGVSHFREISRTIKEKDIDVIVLYGVATNGLPALYAARLAKVPVAFRSIDILNQLVPYQCLQPPTRWLEKAVYKRSDMILSLTPGLTGYLIRLGAPENHIRLLPMPVDTGLFKPFDVTPEFRQKWGITKEDKVIVYIGTLFDFSGLDLAIRHFPKIIEQVPHAKLLIVGDGPQRPRLDSLIKEMKLESKVVITGFQPYDTMPQFLNLATVCLNPFVITGATRDIFPGKIVQYLACGKAVVATPLPGLVVMTPGENEGLVYAATPEEMAEKTAALLTDTAYRQKLERNGLNYVNRRHSHQAIAAQLEDSLKEVVKAKRNG